jgi:peptidase M23-like protein/transglycosylase-like protein with SLT domain
MFEGIAEIAGRVAELQASLEPAPAAKPAAAGEAGPSFAQTLQKESQPTAEPTHRFSVGANGATQLPGSGRPNLAALGGALPGLSGGLGLLSGMNGGGDAGGLAGGLGGALSGVGSGAGSLAGGLGGALSGLGSGGDSLAGGLGGTLSSLGNGAGGLAGGLGGALSGLGGLGGALSGLGSGASGSAEGAGSMGAMQGLVGSVAQQEGVNPALAEAVAKSESGFNPAAVSPAGAQGLMQLMPTTFDAYAHGAGEPSGAPLQGGVSQPFGPTSFGNEPPLDWNGQHYAHFHAGVDLGAAMGTPIRATMGGTIEIRSDPAGYGNLVVVRHGPWDVLYGHTSGQPKGIETGASVRPGQVIGFVGSTGNSTGPHVHYEVRYRGHIVDPTPFLAGRQQAAGSPFDPVSNARAGVGYLKDLLSRFGNNVPAALAAYNAGPGAVEKYGGIPPYPETQNYVRQTMQYAHDLGA